MRTMTCPPCCVTLKESIAFWASAACGIQAQCENRQPEERYASSCHLFLRFLQLQRADPFGPVPRGILYQLAQLDLGLGDPVIKPKFWPM